MFQYYDKKSYKHKNIHWLFILGCLCLVFLLGNLSGQVTVNRKIVIKQVNPVVEPDTNDYSEFNEDNLKHLIKVLNIQHPDIVYAQAVLESGNFKSELFLRNHNLFGMGVPSNRRMLTADTKGKFSNYKANYLQGWQLSVIDYALWQDKYAHFLEREQYLDYLSSAYAEDPKYVDKILKLIN
jgi:hypothetical protein